MSRLLKYEDYLLESIISELILESKVVYSNKFMNILKKMKTNNKKFLVYKNIFNDFLI
jgi:hypothetical protein